MTVRISNTLANMLDGTYFDYKEPPPCGYQTGGRRAMTTYFDREQSIEYRLGSETGPVLQTIANRFCADNPAVPVQYSLRSTQGFSITKDYLDEILLHEKFPQMEREQYVYARAGLTPQAPAPFIFASAHMAL